MILLLIGLVHADWDPGPGCSAAGYSTGPFSVCTECAAEACDALAPGYVYECTNYVGDSGDTAKSTEEEFQVWCVLEQSGDSGADDTGGPKVEPTCGCGESQGMWQAAVAFGLSAFGAGALRRRPA